MRLDPQRINHEQSFYDGKHSATCYNLEEGGTTLTHGCIEGLTIIQRGWAMTQNTIRIGNSEKKHSRGTEL